MLNTIVKAKQAFNWEGTVIPIPFLIQAPKVIAADSGLQFTMVKLYERFDTTRLRKSLELSGCI